MGFIWAQLLATLLISASAGHLRCPLVPSAATGLTLSHSQPRAVQNLHHRRCCPESPPPPLLLPQIAAAELLPQRSAGDCSHPAVPGPLLLYKKEKKKKKKLLFRKMEEEMVEDAANEEESEYSFTVYKIDLDYEFDAARFFDFEQEESPVDARQAELWFNSAGSYPPSPFVENLVPREEILSINISPKSKGVESMYLSESDSDVEADHEIMEMNSVDEESRQGTSRQWCSLKHNLSCIDFNLWSK